MRKSSQILFRFFSVLILLCLPTVATGATTVSKDIMGDTLWRESKSPYKVTADIKLAEGATLKIEPGVVVEFYPEKSLEVNGKLQAIGTAAKPIVFTASDEKPWGTISFTDFSADASFSQSGAFSDGCILSHCVIEKSEGVFIRFGAPFITECEIRNNLSSGIRVEFGGPRIVGNRIYKNSTESDPASGNGGGIIAYTDKDVLIADNVICNNVSDGGRDGGGGVYAYSVENESGQTGNIEITGNTIFGNTSSRFGGGIYAYKALVARNLVIDNKAAERGGGIYAVECEVSDNSVQSNEAQRGGGVFSENGVVKANSITGNRSLGAEGGGMHYFGSGLIENNCIARNSAAGDAACGALYVSGNPVIRANDIVGNDGYALLIANVADAPDVIAAENYWGTLSERLIMDLTYDWLDSESAGLAIYLPPLKQMSENAPPAPPANLIAVSRDNGIELSWEEPGASPVAGHKIYIGSESGYPYETVVQSGPKNSYLATNLEPEKEYFIAVASLANRGGKEIETGLSREVRLIFSPSEEPLKAPVNLAPADKQKGVSGDITLKISAPEMEESAFSSRWQIYAAGDNALNPAIDTVTSGRDWDNCKVAAGKLQSGQQYFWRAASCSPTGNWSDWSEMTSFTLADDDSSILFGPVASTLKLQKARSPYTVAGNTIIMPGGELRIEPGVEVKFAGKKDLKVRGLLVARGTEAEPVLFTRAGSESWGSIIFADQCVDAALDEQLNYQNGNVLEYCRIEKGKGIVIESSSPVIKGCEIANNTGSGIVVRQGGPKIISNNIHHNAAPTNGGGVYAYTNDIIFIQSNRIHENHADGDGGGIYAYGYMNTSAIHVEDNDISKNTATGNGGGVFLSRSSASGNRIESNTAKAGGGGIYSTFGLIDANTITNNEADLGGGIFTEHNSSITRNQVSSNMARSKFGGGVYINFWGTSIENEMFAGNTVTANRCSSKTGNGGVYVLGYLVFEQNNLYQNAGSQLFNANESDSEPLVISNCYWGTANKDDIAREIIDANDDPALGKVTFEPFLNGPVKMD